MKTKGILMFVLLGILFTPLAYGAADYRSMTNEQICREYWQQPTMSPAEQQAYQQEWNRRVQTMSPQERQTLYQQETMKQRTTTTGPSPMAQPGAPAPTQSQMGTSTTTTRDFATMSNEEFAKLCQDQQFMSGLTAEQRREIDREWQRRIPYMTPEERRMYYPYGMRYYTAQ
jgi:hypothetical protein